MRLHSLLMIIHLHIYYLLSLEPRGRQQGQSLATWNFKVSRKTAFFSLVWVYGGSVPPQTLMRMMTKAMMRMVTYKGVCVSVLLCAYFENLHFSVCEQVWECTFRYSRACVCDIHLELLDFPAPPCTPSSPLALSILCKWKCMAIFGESWCHKWFERWAYNCCSRFVWQSDKPWTAPVTDWDLLANTTKSKYSVSLIYLFYLTGYVYESCVWNANLYNNVFVGLNGIFC